MVTPDPERARQHVEQLLIAWRFEKALAALDRLADQPALAEWIREKRAEAEAGPETARANVQALLRTAEELVERHDYEGAVSVLSSVPRPYRTRKLVAVYRSARANAKKVEKLERSIERNLLRKRYNRVPAAVEELLALQPGNGLAKSIKAAMDGELVEDERELDLDGTRVDLAEIRFPDEPRPSIDAVLYGFHWVALGVVLVVVPVVWGLLHLLFAAPRISERFVVDDRLTDGSYEFRIDGEVREPDSLGGLGPGLHQLEIHHDGELAARVALDVREGESPTIYVGFVGGNVVVSTRKPGATGSAEGDSSPDLVVVQHYEGWGALVDPADVASVSFAAGSLLLEVPAGRFDLTARAGPNSAPRIVREFRGDFDVTVEIDDAGTTSTGSASGTRAAGLVVFGEDDAIASLLRSNDATRSTVEFRFRAADRELGGDRTSTPLRVGETTRLRLRRRGANLRADVGSGTAPKTLHVEADALSDSVRVGVVAVNDSERPLTVRFSNLDFEKGE